MYGDRKPVTATGGLRVALALRFGWVVVAALCSAPVCQAAADAAPAAADVVLTHARIYTAAGPELAEALAFRDGVLTYVGDARGVQRYLGAHTQRIDAGGHLVVPGLVDSHIHPVDIIDAKECDLNSAEKTLRQLADFVHGCVGQFRLAPGKVAHRPSVEFDQQ